MLGVAVVAASSTRSSPRSCGPTVTAPRSARRSATSCAPAALGAAVGATGVLIALAAIMGYWALPVFCVPLLLTQFSFKRYATIRATYRQTIRSLARVTEVGGYTDNGHARRVCDMSLAVGRELGLSEAELLDLEYAALMHDIGQLSLVEPIPGGATLLDRARAAPARREGRRGHPPDRRARPRRRDRRASGRAVPPPGEATDPTLPLASRIIRAANAFDDMVRGCRDSRSLAALERLRLAMAYDYDPRVVETLRARRTTLRGGSRSRAMSLSSLG